MSVWWNRVAPHSSRVRRWTNSWNVCIVLLGNIQRQQRSIWRKRKEKEKKCQHGGIEWPVWWNRETTFFQSETLNQQLECVYCTIGEYATPTKKHMEKRKPKTARAKCQYDRIEWTTFFQSETLNQQLECVYCTTLISASNLAACGQTDRVCCRGHLPLTEGPVPNTPFETKDKTKNRYTLGRISRRTNNPQNSDVKDN